MRSALPVVAHMAVWAGLYVAAGVVCFTQIAGLTPLLEPGTWLQAVAFAFCLAVAVYLLDRVKLCDAWLDPADELAHPRRYAFLAARTRTVRWLIAALLVLATILGERLGRGVIAWGGWLPVGAVAGVLIYAARPRQARPRPKDRLLIKNLYVGTGITGFAILTTLTAVLPHGSVSQLRAFLAPHFAPMGFSAGHLLLRVCADAVLCDLDDEAADRQHGTHTLPGRVGRERAWNLAVGLRLGLAVLLALAAGGFPTVPAVAMWCWAGVTVVSSIALRWAAPAQVRDWVDARFALEAIVTWFVLSFAHLAGP